MPSRPVNLIVIHCSASPNSRSLFTGEYNRPGFVDPAMEIDRWHAERNFRREDGWRKLQNPHLKSIGYHFVISRNGAPFTGRHVDEVGAHVHGWNKSSLGICLVGTDQFTPRQWDMLAGMVRGIAGEYPVFGAPAGRQVTSWTPPAAVLSKNGVERAGVCGHRDVPGVAKSCPGFDVFAWLRGGMKPLPGHIDTRDQS